MKNKGGIALNECMFLEREIDVYIASDGNAICGTCYSGGPIVVPHIDSNFRKSKHSLMQNIFDDWNKVMEYMRKQEKRYAGVTYADFEICGYELVHDNHFVALYSKVTPYFT